MSEPVAASALAIHAEMAINQWSPSITARTLRLLRPRRRSISWAMTFETFGSVGIDVEHHHANRVAVPSAHQLSDSGFVVGAVEIGLCERSTEPAIVVDDDVIVLALTVGSTVPCAPWND